MKRESIKLIKALNIASYPGALVVIYFMYPSFMSINVNFKYALIWFVVSGIGITYLNHKYLSIVEQAKDTVDLKDFLSSIGRAKIRKNLDEYFPADIAKQYKSFFLIMYIYMGIAGIGLILVAILIAQKSH
jgi:hypothetical protein